MLQRTIRRLAIAAATTAIAFGFVVGPSAPALAVESSISVAAGAENEGLVQEILKVLFGDDVRGF